MMSRVFYANEDARTPFYIQLLLALVYVVGVRHPVSPVDQIIYRHRHPLHRRKHPLRDRECVLPAPPPGPSGRAEDRQLIYTDGLRRTRRSCGRCRRSLAAGQLQSGGLRVEQPACRTGDHRRRRAGHAGRLLAPAQAVPCHRTARPFAAAARAARPRSCCAAGRRPDVRPELPPERLRRPAPLLPTL